MDGQMIWLIAGALLIAGLLIGFFASRFTSPKKRIRELEEEVTQQKERMAEYRKSVDAHFDKTADLFVTMTGSYKALYEHLSEGYEKLAPGSRQLFREKVATLLLTETPVSAEDLPTPPADTPVQEEEPIEEETFIEPAAEETQSEAAPMDAPVDYAVEEYEQAIAPTSDESEAEEQGEPISESKADPQEEDIPVLNDRVEDDDEQEKSEGLKVPRIW